MNAVYYEQKYCNDCVSTHWVEVTRNGRIICHGYTFAPAETTTHYTRRLGRGIEMVKKSKHWEPKEPEPLPVQWQLAIEARQDIEF